MAAACGVVVQLVLQCRTKAAGVVPVEAHADGDSVRQREIYAILGVGENIRVVPQTLHGALTVGALERHGQRHGEVVPRQKLHHLSQSRQGAESGGHLLRLFPGDALDALQLLRLLLENQQRILPEPLDQPLRDGGPHALEYAGGEVGHDVRLALRHTAFHALGGEL